MNWVTRQEWGARAPRSVTNMALPVSFVVIHHSFIPAACQTTPACKNAMRSMQDSHQLRQGWSDIGYNFAIGGDGRVYVGRGFRVVGAHAPS